MTPEIHDVLDFNVGDPMKWPYVCWRLIHQRNHRNTKKNGFFTVNIALMGGQRQDGHPVSLVVGPTTFLYKERRDHLTI